MNRFSAAYLFITVVLLSTTLLAQGRMSLEERVEILEERLELNETQKEQVTEILESAFEKMSDLRNDQYADRTMMREQMRTLMKEADDQIINILNDDQKVEYQEIMEERKERMKNRRRR